MWTMSLPSLRNVNFPINFKINILSRLQMGISRKIYGWSTQALRQKELRLHILRGTCYRTPRVIFILTNNNPNRLKLPLTHHE
jgi:hypothetical protein